MLCDKDIDIYITYMILLGAYYAFVCIQLQKFSTSMDASLRL